MESKSWLANGHARTSTARKRTRNAWVDISAVLNKDDTGCKKTAEQWSKYWKDKKAAVKRKVNKVAVARKTSSEGIEEFDFSEVEQKMLALMEGENTGNENQTDPFQDDQVSDDPMEQSNADDEDDDVKPSNVLLVSNRRQSEEKKASDSESSSEREPLTRCAAPSESQLLRLIYFLESKPWLVNGHARTSGARKRTRNAWVDISAVLNKDDTGCKKTAEQWAKYWKDKKGSLKRKVNKIAASRKMISGGNEEIQELSEVEHKMLALMGGENAVLGSQNQTDPFHDDRVSDDAMEKSNVDDEDDDVKPSNVLLTHTIVIPSTSRQTAPAEEMRRLSNIEEQPVSSRRQSKQKKAHISESSSEPSHPENLKGEAMSGRRRHILQQSLHDYPTRRRLRRSPSSRSRRRSELTMLTERFLAIEEKRVEAELITAHSRKNYARGQLTMAQAIDRLAGAINIYATGVNKLLEHVINK